jgi:hypothetical protein
MSAVGGMDGFLSLSVEWHVPVLATSSRGEVVGVAAQRAR